MIYKCNSLGVRLTDMPWQAGKPLPGRQVSCVRELADNPDAFQITPGSRAFSARWGRKESLSFRAAVHHIDRTWRTNVRWPFYLSVD